MKPSASAIVFLLACALLPSLSRAMPDDVIYTYDDLNRLTRATFQYRGYALQYGYDEIGNITGITTQPAEVSIQGTVRDAYGAPLAGVEIHATIAGETLATAITGGDGRYLIAGLAPGQAYILKAYTTDAQGGSGSQLFPQSVFASTGGGNEDLVLSWPPPDFTITGRVSFACSGSPLADAMVSVSYSDAERGYSRITQSGGDGLYSLAGLPRYANYTLTISPSAAAGPPSIVISGINGASGSPVTKDVAFACDVCVGDELSCAPPAPHDVSNAIGCADCHAAAGGQPVDYACETCHTNSTGRDYDKLN
ncbi:MAG: carboxypeptidase regulatory-like domain-containing protein, partial [Thermodesulfobacteriota bacterium]